MLRSAVCVGLLPLLIGVSRAQVEGPSGPTVGQSAPTFRLNNHAGSSEAFGGERPTWTLLAFYPKSMTPG